jgi:3-phenylpropionate/trans-cinnamate dioxygenase ferredoxin reductase subunit
MSEVFELLAIGGGPGSLAAARAYRQAGGGGAVAIVSDEQRVPYRRPPLTKELLRGELSERELAIEPEPWYAEHGVVLLCGRAVGLEPERRTVTLAGGRELHYRSCLLATGGEPKRLPIPGADDPAVRVLRSLDDLRELLVRLEPGEPLAVIGAGFIGCEIAASLRLRGHPVTSFCETAEPNEPRLGSEAAALVAGWLSELGVELCRSAPVRRIERAGEQLTVIADRARSQARCVIMAGGIAPRGELAAAAGISTLAGAIRTDSGMRSDRRGVLAAGDVALAENVAAGRPLPVEHWGEALAHGEVAGRVLAGEPARWSQVPGFWSTIGRRTLKYAGWGDGFDCSRLESRPDGAFTVWYGRDGHLVGVLAHKRDQDYQRGLELIREGTRWPG